MTSISWPQASCPYSPSPLSSTFMAPLPVFRSPWSHNWTSKHAILSVWNTFPILPYCLVFLHDSEVISSERLTLTIWSKSSLTCVSQCLEHVWKQVLDPVPRVSNPVGLWWELRMYISSKFLGDAEAAPCLESHLPKAHHPCALQAHFVLLPFFFFLQICGNPVWLKSKGAIFPTAFAHFFPLCHILIILTFQTFPLLFYWLWWSVISNLWYYCYKKACGLWKGSDDG